MGLSAQKEEEERWRDKPQTTTKLKTSQKQKKKTEDRRNRRQQNELCLFLTPLTLTEPITTRITLTIHPSLLPALFLLPARKYRKNKKETKKTKFLYLLRQTLDDH